jgi:hypothetical protein
MALWEKYQYALQLWRNQETENDNLSEKAKRLIAEKTPELLKKKKLRFILILLYQEQPLLGIIS